MATYYLDPEGGNDANNGTTFALRKRTIASFTTLTAGDVVRIKESPAPNDIGSAGWADNNSLITCAVAPTLEVNQGVTAWTANPPGVTSTTSTTRKRGNTATSISIAAAFASAEFPALVAYQTTAANLNLSAYTGISFWIRKTTAGGNLLPDGRIRIRLCSDTLGLVNLQELTWTFPSGSGVASIVNGQWTPVVLQTNAPLPTGINSIAIYMSQDPGACTFLVNNFVAIKADSDAQHISHASVVGKNTVAEPEWYPIQALINEQVFISPHSATPATLRPYRGVTETANLWGRRPVNPGMTAAQRTLGQNGADGNPLILEGGWDSASMSTKTGTTLWSGFSYFGTALTLSNRRYVEVRDLDTTFYTGWPLGFNSTARDIVYSTKSVSNIAGIVAPMTGTTTGSQGHLILDHLTHYDGPLQLGSSGTAPCYANIRRITGCMSNGVALGITTPEPLGCLLEAKMIDNHALHGVINSATATVGVVRGATFQNNTTNNFSVLNGLIYADYCTFPAGSVGVTSPSAPQGALYLTAFQGDPMIHSQARFGSNAFTQTAVVNTPGSAAWALQINTLANFSSKAPATVALATIAVLGGSPVTIQCKVRRLAAGAFVAGIMVPSGSVTGVTSQTALATAAAGTWETLSVTINPTVNGVVELRGFCYGAASTAYFDDIIVS